MFVKPARGGSSIGVSRVTAWDQLPAAIAYARRHDPKVIVEAAVPGRELECGVLEFPDGRVEASTVGEIRVAGVRGREDGFYDFATKYLDDAAELDVPAKIDDEVADEMRQLAIRAFHAIDCQGLARVDFFLTEDGPVINEINTMPGFTTISMYPRMWAASGVDYPTLLADDGRDGASPAAPACVEARTCAPGVERAGRGSVLRRSPQRSPGSASGPIPGQGQSDIHRPVDGEPGAAPDQASLPAPASPTRNHCTSSTTCRGARRRNRRAGPARSAGSPARRPAGLPRRGAGGAGSAAGRAPVVAELRRVARRAARGIRRCRPAARAPTAIATGLSGGACGSRRRPGSRPIATDRHDQRRDQQRPRRPVPVSVFTPSDSRLTYPVGDRTGQGAGDAGDLLHARNDVGLQVAQGLGADAHHDVVRAGHVLRRQHTRAGRRAAWRRPRRGRPRSGSA